MLDGEALLQRFRKRETTRHELTMVGRSTVRVGSTGGVVMVSLAVGSGRHLEKFG